MKRLRIFGVAAIALCVLAMFIVERLAASAPHLITITGAGTAVRLSTTDQQAATIQFTTPAANTGIARIGDSTTSSTIGQQLPANSGQFFGPRWQGTYSLNTWYVWVAVGDTLTVLWVDAL